MSGPKPLSNILEITPYKGGQKLDHGWKLSSNENALGCSPAALRALGKAAEHLELYPDGSAFELRQAIGEKYGIDAHVIATPPKKLKIQAYADNFR